MSQRIGVIGIVVQDRDRTAARINQILGEYAHLIVGRMGIPYRERNVSVISLIIDGDTDDIGALSGKLGNIKGVQVKSALVSKD
jgi:putative iron-only hydrogenase system regulator